MIRSPESPAPGRFERLARDVGEIKVVPVLDAALAPSQGEQAVDEALLALRPRSDLFGHRAQRVDAGGTIRERDVDRRALHGERHAQLVRCVRDEPPMRVERVAEFLQLVVRTGEADAFVQVLRRQAASGGRYPAQRPQRPSGGEPAHPCIGTVGPALGREPDLDRLGWMCAGTHLRQR